jgi:hypothetical protein
MGRSARRSALLALAIGCAARGARADEPTPAQLQAARDLFAAAERDEDGEHWSDALEKLRRVADVKLTAGVRYHVALCEEKLGRVATAYAHYVEARDAAAREGNAEVLGLMSDPILAKLRARVPTLTLDVPSAAGVSVTVDGVVEPPGLWRVPVPIDPGAHRIEATAPGRAKFARQLEVRERDVTVLAITFDARGNASANAGVNANANASASASANGNGNGEAASPLPLILASSALVLAGGGVVAFVLAPSDSKAAWDAAAVGAWIGAAGLATAAVVVWASQPKGDAGSVGVAIGPGALRIEGKF